MSLAPFLILGGGLLGGIGAGYFLTRVVRNRRASKRALNHGVEVAAEVDVEPPAAPPQG